MPSPIDDLHEWAAGDVITAAQLNGNFSKLKDWLSEGNITATHLHTKYATQTLVLQREDALNNSSVSFNVKLDAAFLPKLATLHTGDVSAGTPTTTLQIKDGTTQILTGDTLSSVNTETLQSTSSFAVSEIASGTTLTFVITETESVNVLDITVSLTGLVEVRSA